MYTIAVISLSTYTANKDKMLQIYEMFKEYIPLELRNKEEFKLNDNKIQMPIDKDSEAFKKIIEIAKKNYVSFHTYEYTEYTREEERNAKYFQMFVSDPLESEGTSAGDYGTKYLNSCDTCEIGGKLVGDVLVDRKFIKKQGIASLRPDIIVSSEIKWLIETNDLTGVNFTHAVKDYKGREMPEYYVMSFEHIMPPMKSQTWFSFEPPAKKCEKCGIEIPYLKSHCYYSEFDFQQAYDFNLTYELYDNYAERGLIISKKVKEVFSKARVRVGYRMLNIV